MDQLDRSNLASMASPLDGGLDSQPKLRFPGYFQAPQWLFASFLIWVWARYIEAGVRGGGILGSFRFEFVLGGILILLCMWVLFETPLRAERSKYVLISISLLFLASLIQIPFAARPSLAQHIFTERIVKFAFLTMFVASLVRSPRAMKLFLAVFLVSIFWITQESVRGLISGALVWQNQGIMRLHGAVPIYAHPNSLGGVSMGAVPFVVFLWGAWRRWWMRIGLLAVLTTSMTCVLFSGSRTSYVATLAFLLFWFMRSQKKLRWIVVSAVAMPLAISLMPEQYIERFETIGAQEGEGTSQAARKEILRDAWAIFLESPGGVGLGCFPVVRAQKFGRTQDTHNLYLEVATNLGIHGFCVFMFFVGAMMWGFFSSYSAFQKQSQILARISRSGAPPGLLKRVRAHEADLQLLRAVANAGAGFIYIRLMLGLFGMDLYEIYWWFGAGIAIALLEMIDQTRRRTHALQAVHAAWKAERA